MQMCLGFVTAAAVLVACSACASTDEEPRLTPQEGQCIAAGWRRERLPSVGLQRRVLWKAPAGPWSRGAIVVLHGGGGSYTHFCVANAALIAAQVRFTDAALARGYAVFLADSSDRVTDHEGRLCGKVWDDEVRERGNLDLPFLEQLLRDRIPALRPTGSHTALFMTGLSSGGFMTVRAATSIGQGITAFAPVAAGDPYGWTRDCTPLPTDRHNVFGHAFDNGTRRPISHPGACLAAAYANERPWDGSALTRRPYRIFHHAQDGVLDRSCVDKLQAQLVAHGFAATAPYMLDGGSRSVSAHYWQDGYNVPLLDYFDSQH